jgi:hypothetical protein
MQIHYWTDHPRTDPNGTVKWYCWVYVYGDEETAFDDWVRSHFTTGDKATRRFNSGNPMTEVTITNEEVAMLFKLTFSEFIH